MGDVKISSMIAVLVVDAHMAALMMDGDVVAKCETKGMAYEIAAKVNSHDKLVEQNKMLREALSMVVDKLPIYQNIHGGGYMIVLSHDDVCIIKETLNISEM
jgi:hypothetical protein